jgi:hypothetical protein
MIAGENDNQNFCIFKRRKAVCFSINAGQRKIRSRCTNRERWIIIKISWINMETAKKQKAKNKNHFAEQHKN